ncbi:beta-lactamase/transpeptidase-like protein [Mycena olivaceomarginata]|nr:beta-lactamase/transpeptidase-like protein [Mycena olivaceomarginata]
MSLGIVSPNGDVEFGAWGNKTESGESIAPDTIFGIGSLSKGFLSASLGILMQDFADGTNTTALPSGWRTEDEFSTYKADLRDLLSHVTGLPSHDMSYSSEDSPPDLVLRMRHLRAAYEFRQLLEYNNQMFVTGSYVVAKLSGMAYRDFVEKHIMLPLNMSSSTMHPDRVSKSDRFSQTWTPSGRRIPFFATEQTVDLIAGAGGVISTAEDLLLWAKLILNGGVDSVTNTTIIPKATFDLATTGQSILTHQGDGLLSAIEYGLGWARTAYRGHELVLHNGGAPGISSMCTVYPQDGFAVVVLANTAGTGTQNVALAVADCILGLPSPSSAVVPAPANVASPAPKVSAPAVPPNVLSGLAGTYSNVGYGNFTLCSAAQTTSPTSLQCAGVVQDFAKVDTAAGKPSNSAELYSAWSRFWGTHLRLTPASGNDYVAQLTTLYVDGYGEDHTPFEDAVDDFRFKITFMEEKGKKGGNVRDTADAWFDKL